MKTNTKTVSAAATQTAATQTAAPSITLPLQGKGAIVPLSAIETKLHRFKSAVGRLASKVESLPADEIGGRTILKFDLSLATTETPGKIIAALAKRGLIDKATAKELREGFALVAALMTV